MSACVVLAWCILPLAAMAGFRISGPSHASGSTAVGISTVTSISTARTTTPVILTSESAIATPPRTTRPAQRPAAWTVRPGDSLTAIATALGIPGGWQALYAANRHAIGPNPNMIGVGTVLALPGAAGATRYTVGPGDSLSAIATALGVPGGWQALYAANRHAIGPNPNAIRPGIILATPRQATRPTNGQPPRPSAPAQAHPRHSAAPAPVTPSTAPTAKASAARSSHLTAPSAPAGGMPRWLLDVLLAAGVLAVTAFAAEPAAAIARRRKANGNTSAGGNAAAARPHQAAGPIPGAWSIPRPRRARHRQTDNAANAANASHTDKNENAGTTDNAGYADDTRHLARQAADKARIILADHERLIVTYSVRDHTVYVLTPPGEDPMAVLSAARLVLPEDTYKDLAGHLGVPSAWPAE
jgi:LysM repeat protein